MGVLCAILDVTDLIISIVLYLAKGFMPRKPVLLLNNIDRFAIRTARIEYSAHWQQFEVQIRQCIARHSTPPPSH